MPLLRLLQEPSEMSKCGRMSKCDERHPYRISVQLVDVDWWNTCVEPRRPFHSGTWFAGEIVPLQARIEEAHLKWVLKGRNYSNDTAPTVLTRQFPEAPAPLDVRYYREGMAALFAAAFLPIFCVYVYIIVREKTTGIKEMLGVMGLDDLPYWLSHLSTVLMMNVISCVPVFYMFTFVKTAPAGSVPFPNADPILIAVALFMFSLMATMHTLLVASVFNKANVAVTFALMYWSGFVFALPWLPTERLPWSMSQYLFSSRAGKLLCSVTPCLGTYWVFKILGIACDVQGGASFSLVTEKVLNMDNVTILEIWSVMLATVAVIAVLIWYLSQVLPWVTGIPKPFYFPFMSSYWRPSEALQGSSAAATYRDPGRFEEGPEDIPVEVNIMGLRKNFGSFIVLDGIDLKLYKGEITALLGHNGAGKTTMMSILTGILPPTEGTAVICGYDIVKQTFNARKNISLCPQFDIFFDDLTVWEHLAFFGTLKGLPKGTLNAKIDEVLKLVNIADKSNSIPPQLSGGMKRRLSVAIAAVSSPKVVILDEPSSGLDPETRREMWDLFLGMRKKCSLILSTHDMEEADVLGDRIAIMSQGQLCCYGSPVFLKRKFGAGYELIFGKASSGLDVQRVLRLLRETAPDAEIVSDSLTDTRISLGVKEIKGFPEMFEQLESHGASLGIANIGVSMSTMEDVYIKVNLEIGHDAGVPEVQVNEEHVHNVCSLNERRPNPLQRLQGLLVKRCIYYRRAWATPVITNLIPLLIFLSFFVIEGCSLKGNLEATVYPEDDVWFIFRDSYPSAGTFSEYGPETEEFVVKHYRPLLESEASTLSVFNDPVTDLLKLAAESFDSYANSYVLGGSVLENNTYHAWWNPYYRFSSVFSLNLMNTALLRFITKQPTARMSLGVRVNTTLKNEPSPQITTATNNYFSTLGMRLIFRTPSFSLGCSFVSAAPVLMAVTERISLSKHLQLMSGISSSLFWLSNLMFDVVVSVLTWIVVGLLFQLYTPMLPVTAAAFLLWAVGSSFMMSSIAYCLSFKASSPYGGFTALLLFVSFGGTACIAINLLGRAFQHFPHAVVVAVSVLPPSLPPFTLMKLLEMDTSMRQCAAHASERAEDTFKAFLTVVCESRLQIELSPGLKYCCNGYNAEEPPEDIVPSPFLMTEEGIVFDLMIMFAQGLLALVIVCVADSSTSRVSRITSSEKASDDDVEAERALVEKLCTTGDFSGCSLVVRNIQKSYGDFQAVKGLSFTVRQKECFGLLGVNGAGKTTTFRVLTGLLQPSSGDAYMKDLVMTKNNRQWQSNIGYCPQLEGLLGKLNSYQSLYLYARLRGIPEKDIRSLVDSMIEVADLTQYAAKPCESYSGGNKRKLSTAIATIGLPALVFLDEPTAGVDVVARKKIFSAVKRIRAASGISVILTSHSMDECEAACDRIGIMADGQFRCLGPLQHLKAKFGRGCSLTLKMPTKDESQKAAVQDAVIETFPGIQLKDYHQGVFEFQLDSRMQWSILFQRMSSLQEQFRFEQVSVSDTTLEQIFIGFAKKAPTPGKIITPGSPSYV